MKALSFDHIGQAEELTSSAKAFAMLTGGRSVGKSFLDRFYLTGYEGLCLSLSHKDLTRSVVSSAVPMGGELLAIGSEEACALWRAVCAELKIRLTVISADSADIVSETEATVSANSRISHILCTTSLSYTLINRLSGVAHGYRLSVIVDNTADEISMGDIEASGADFVLAAADGAEAISIIIARRSRLVMTEGNARHFDDDLYALWQSSLTGRDSTWAPMV